MRRLLLSGMLIIILVACTQNTSPLALTPSDSPLPATITPSPTNTSFPTRTLIRTKTPKNTLIPSATITPPSVRPVALSPLALNEFNAGTEMTRLAVYGTGEPTDMAWSPDGKTFAVATTRGVWLYDGETFSQSGFIDTNNSVSSLAFSPDGSILALGIDGKINLWSSISQAPIKTIETDELSLFELDYGKGGQIAGLGVSHHADYINVDVGLWDEKTGEEILSEKDILYYMSPVFSPDGRILAYGSGEGLRLVESKTGKFIATKNMYPQSIGFNQAGDRLFVIDDFNRGENIIWDFNNERQKPLQGCLLPMAWSRDTLLCGGGSAGAVFVDLTSGEKTYELNIHATNYGNALRPDGSLLAMENYNQKIAILDTKNGNMLKILSWDNFYGGSESQNFASGIITFNGIDIPVLATANDQYILLWNIKNGNIFLRFPYNSYLSGVAIGPDKKTVAISDQENGMRLWNIESNSFIVVGEANISGPIGFSPDGRKLAYYKMPTDMQIAYGVTDEKTVFDLLSSKVESMGPNLIRMSFREKFLFLPNGNLLDLNFQNEQYFLVNTASHENILLPDVKNNKWYGNGVSEIDSMSISSNGDLFTYAKYNGIIEVWDLPSRKLLKSFQGHPGIQTQIDIWSTVSMAYSPKSNLLVTVGADGTTRLWNALTGTELRRLNVCCYADFTPDGRYLVTAGAGVIRVWGLPEP